MKTKSLSALCGAGMVLASLSLRAELPAPVEGVITIPDGETVTVSTSDEATTLAGATEIVLGAGSTLNYTCADALALSAAVSGTGTFKATSAGTVSISGDNSGLVSPGHFDFSETEVWVSSDNGLGGANSGTAYVRKASGANNLLHFHDATDKVVTNNAPLYLVHALGSGNATYLGSEASDEYVVQNANMTDSGGTEAYLRCRGNFEMCHGTFIFTGYTRFYPPPANCWFVISGDTYCNFGAQFIYYSDANRMKIGGSGITCSDFAENGGKNILLTKSYALGSSFQLTGWGGGTYLNLNGTTQEIAFLKQNEAGTKVISTPTGKPALLKAAHATTTDKRTVNYQFTGPLSYWHATSQNLTFGTTRHTATGELIVEGPLAFASGSGWVGSAVTVTGSKGVLDCQTANALNSSSTTLTVKDGGTLKIGSGILVSVKAATFGSVELEAGTSYTVAELQTLIAGEDVTVSGEGTLQVVAVWDGWPEVGTATKWTVPRGLTVPIEESDIPKVEALEEIEIGSGSTVTYAVAQPLNLTAKITGSGSFTATSAGKVTLSGDNALVSPGKFSFTSTDVHLSNSNALGGASAAMAVYNKSSGIITVDYNANGCFTNNSPLQITQGSSTIGSDSLSHYYVQNASLTMNNAINFRNNFEMCHGTFTSGGDTPYWSHGTGSSGAVKLTGDTATYVPAKTIIYFSNLQIGGKSYSAPGGLATDSTRNITMIADYVLSESTVLNPYAQSSEAEYSPYYNLNGHSQNIAYLSSSQTTGFASVRSETGPCTLGTMTTATGTIYAPFIFRDAISYSNGCGKVHQFKARHTATGDLWVTKGGVTFLANGTAGGGWAGKNVTVSGTGVLKCESAVSLNTGRHNLVVENGGTLVISNNVTLKVGTARFGNVTLDLASVYTADQIRTLVAGENVTVLGGGTIQTSTKSIPGTWAGWPEVGTATKWQVPDDAVVTIEEADIPKVEALAEIETGIDAKITYSVSGKTLNLGAKVTGGSTLRAVNAGTLVLNGDNSELFAPGGFYVAGTTVIVSNRYGLGGARTASAVFYPKTPYASNLSVLWFGGEAKTNDVQIESHYGIYVGYQVSGVPFVQNANVVHSGDTSANQRFTVRNDFTVASNATLSAVAVSTTSGSFLHIASGASMTGLSGIFGSGSYSVAGTLAGNIAIEQCVHTLRCDADNCLSGLSSINLYDESLKDFCLDLNGCSQTVKLLYGRSYWNSNQQAFDVTSAKPATLTLNSSDTKTAYGAALRLAGAVSLVKNNVSTQVVGCVTSVTEGTLTVNGGALTFERSAKWLGGTVYLNGGALIVAESAGTGLFNATGRKSKVELEVTDGTLALPSSASTPSVRRAKVNGAYLPKGTYTAANCDWITGEGSLTVDHGPYGGAAFILR